MRNIFFKSKRQFFSFLFFFLLAVSIPITAFFVASQRDFDDRGEASGDNIIRFAVTGDGHWNITRGDNKVNNRENYGNSLDYKYRHNLMMNLLNDEAASSKGLDFVVFNGDLVHNDGREWENVKEQYDRLNVPYRVVHGNHDSDEHGKRSISDWEDLWGNGYDHHEEYKGVGFIMLGTGVEYRAGNYWDKPWDFNYFKKWADYYTNQGKPVFLFTHVAFDHSRFGGCEAYCGVFGDGQKFHDHIIENPLIKATFYGHNHTHRGVRIIDGHPYYWSGHFGHQPPTKVNPMSYRIVEIDTNTGDFESYSVNALTKEIGDESFTSSGCGSLGKAYSEPREYPASTTTWPSGDFCVQGGTVTRMRFSGEPIVHFPSNPDDFFPKRGSRVDWECRVGINSSACSAKRLASDPDPDPTPDPDPFPDPDPTPDPGPDPDPTPDPDPDPDPTPDPGPTLECERDSDCPSYNKAPYEICFKRENVCLRGDVNNDRRVGMSDFSFFNRDFVSFKKEGWSSELRRSDFNEDNRISMADYSIFVRSYRVVHGLEQF